MGSTALCLMKAARSYKNLEKCDQHNMVQLRLSSRNGKKKIIFEAEAELMKPSATVKFSIKTRLLVSGRSPECSDRLLRIMEQQ